MKKSLFYLLISILLLSGCAKDKNKIPSEDISIDRSDYETIERNPYFSLKVPTYITNIDGLYFIVDCYNDQVIYNDDLEDDICYWSVMTKDIKMGHTVASDGEVYLIDDTENNRILIMEKDVNKEGKPYFYPTQEFKNIGVRPHYIIYNKEDKTFYAWSSMTGQMYLFKKDKDSDKVFLTDIKSIDELNGFYVRSFTIMGDEIYFVSGNKNIIVADLKTFKIKQRYPVPDELFGMIQLEKIEDYYYITISTDITGSQDAATLIRTKDLNSLINGDYEDVYDKFIGGGTPYAITKIGEDYYLCEHRLPEHSIWKFNVENNEIINQITLY